jgi:hypothetical protein
MQQTEMLSRGSSAHTAGFLVEKPRRRQLSPQYPGRSFAQQKRFRMTTSTLSKFLSERIR